MDLNEKLALSMKKNSSQSLENLKKAEAMASFKIIYQKNREEKKLNYKKVK
jgi:hypothetical protein